MQFVFSFPEIPFKRLKYLLAVLKQGFRFFFHGESIIFGYSFTQNPSPNELDSKH